MKTHKFFLITFISVCSIAYGQGTFIYDQQSNTESGTTEGGGNLQSNQPFGQSFTPTFSSVGFIRLKLYDFDPGNSLGATVYVNLLAISITGTVLAASSPVFMPDDFLGYTDFLFLTPVSVTPGTTYYFQPVVQSGDAWIAAWGGSSSYSNGTAFSNGQAVPFQDLWFREGIVVPEPSPSWLILLGSGIFLYVRRTLHR